MAALLKDRRLRCALGILSAVLIAGVTSAHAATSGTAAEPLYLAGIPIDFILFGLTLLGVALFHHHTMAVALTGLAAITGYKLLFTGFKFGTGLAGLAGHMAHEWVILGNLFCLLMGFALLSRHFEESKIPDVMPAVLPDDWKGGFVLLALVFVLSGFLDNIAAAMIGATVARTVFRGNVHIGFLAAIVAAANAGGAGSVLGDTTTTMMWLDGVSPLDVMRAYVAAVAAFFVFAIPAARQQHRFAPIQKDPTPGVALDASRLIIVVLVLACAIGANVYANTLPGERAGEFPYIGATVIGVILFLTPWRRPDWSVLPAAARGGLFLLSLVLAASMMPVEDLPDPSALTTLGLGLVSAVFDNIPLTKLALEQGGYDWGLLAYAVGFGGSMLWFGSSAGVAVSNLMPGAKSAVQWLRHGWHVALAYVTGFAVFLLLLGWSAPAAR
jgi:Na+/H+ antiporter NhaD/arsenite permease-like protein